MAKKQMILPVGGQLIGYARVSTEEQNLDMQVEALKRHGVPAHLIFADKVSGVAKKRPGRDAAIRQCARGDTLVVWKLDRITRSLLDLLKLLEYFEAEGVNFKSLTDPIDTSGPIGRAIVAIIGAVAQLERDLIAQRTSAGVRRAQERGVKFGQPTIMTAENQAKIWKWVNRGDALTECAERLGCHVGTLRRVYTFPVLQAIRAGKKPKINTASKRRK